jgi:hypothetical protein
MRWVQLEGRALWSFHEVGSAGGGGSPLVTLRSGFSWGAEHSGPSTRWVQLECGALWSLHEVGSAGKLWSLHDVGSAGGRITLVPPHGGFSWGAENSGLFTRWVPLGSRKLWTLHEVGSAEEQKTLVPSTRWVQQGAVNSDSSTRLVQQGV